MRTRFVESKSESPPPATFGRLMASPRPPLRRRNLRSSSGERERESDESEGEEGLMKVAGVGHLSDYKKLGRWAESELEMERQAERRAELPESKRPDEARDPSPMTIIVIVVVLFAVIVAAGIAAYYYRPAPDPKVYDEWLWTNLTTNMRAMRSEFPSQSADTWLNFASGIRRVLTGEPTEPTVFLLVHSGGETCGCLARKVARVAQGLMEAPGPGPLVVEGAALSDQVDGLLVEAYKPLVERHGTLLLEGLEAVPAEVARWLHIFCDTVTPLVRKAVYVFTLDVRGTGTGGEGAAAVAQRGLEAAWGRLHPDVLAPLVARVMGGFVVAVEPEGVAGADC